MLRVLVASAKECPVDKAGRTLVPPELREFAGLHKDVVITGALRDSRSGAATAGASSTSGRASASTRDARSCRSWACERTSDARAEAITPVLGTRSWAGSRPAAAGRLDHRRHGGPRRPRGGAPDAAHEAGCSASTVTRETLALAAARLAPFGGRDRAAVRRLPLARRRGARVRRRGGARGPARPRALLVPARRTPGAASPSRPTSRSTCDSTCASRSPRRSCLRTTPEPELARIIHDVRGGAGRAADRPASGAARARAPIVTTRRAGRAGASAIPPHRRSRRIHPATRTFQALRIAVNDELGGLEAAFPKGARAPGATRPVRRDRVPLPRGPSRQARLPAASRQDWFRDATRKPIRPSRRRGPLNPRARSARFRVLERR